MYLSYYVITETETCQSKQSHDTELFTAVSTWNIIYIIHYTRKCSLGVVCKCRLSFILFIIISPQDDLRKRLKVKEEEFQLLKQQAERELLNHKNQLEFVKKVS